MNQVSYIAMSIQDHERLMKATEQPDMVSVQRACEMFDVSSSLIDTLVAEKKLTKYSIPDHPRTTRFKVVELQNLFKKS